MSPPLQIHVLLFAAVRDAADSDFVDVTVQESPTAGQVIAAVAKQIPDASGLIQISRLAVDGQYVAAEFRIDNIDCEFALIPPVSGG